jgi:hypothetical protein
MGRDGRVTDERRLLAGVEEAQPQVVIRGVRGEDEGGLRVRILARHRRERGVAQAVGIEHHRRRVAGETLLGKGVDLENSHPQSPPPDGPKFYTPARRRLH